MVPHGLNCSWIRAGPWSAPVRACGALRCGTRWKSGCFSHTARSCVRWNACTTLTCQPVAGTSRSGEMQRRSHATLRASCHRMCPDGI